MNWSRIFFCLVFLSVLRTGFCQDTSSLYSRIYNLPDKFFNSIYSKAAKLQSKIEQQTEKYLKKLEKEERRLRRKLAKKDSLAAAQMFGDIDDRYKKLKQQLNDGRSGFSNLNSIYSGHVDSMKTALKFLQQDKLLASHPELQAKINGALQSYKSIQSGLGNVQDIRKYLKERQLELQSQLEKFGLAKELKEFKKQVYYYRAQMDEYKQMLNDPSKLERKALQLASKVPAFKNFFNKYSDLAGLFRVPDDYGSLASLQGLQTRVDVQQLIQQRIAAGGPNAQLLVQQNISQAQAELTQLKNKLNQFGKGSSDEDMPDFKPNNQKTKSFLQRLEFGSNLQTARSNYFFPMTTDFGLSVGYKLNDKSVIGIGGSYKVGFGKDWGHIAISHQGFGLRSFVDLKLKGSFWISGGGEMNYRSEFYDWSIFNDYTVWQKSALLGITKKYSIGKKFKGRLQLMFDFLHAQQVPRTHPVVFRFGYNLNK